MIVGAAGRNRTTDTGIFSPLLYLLSYRGIISLILMKMLVLLQAFSFGDPEGARTLDLQRDRLAY